jgi:hypothetical protein
MDPNYRATEDHWRLIENWPGLGEYPGASCLLELRARIKSLEEGSTEQAESNRLCTDAIVARIEALEAAQQPAPATEESSATAPPAPEVAKLADRLDRIATQLFSIGGWDDHSASVARAATLLRQLSAPAGVQRRYPSPATIAECGGPCDSQGPWACDCGLLDALNPPMPAPAGGLVKRLSHLLAKRFSESRPGTDCTPLAREVVREVVKWLRSDGPGWPFAHLLEREANR